MINNSLLLSLVMVPLVITGCATQKVVVTEYVPVLPPEIPKKHLKPCTATPPPNKEEYMNPPLTVDPNHPLTAEEYQILKLSHREVMLANYATSLRTDLVKCNGQIEAINAHEKTVVETFKKNEKK